MRLVPLILFLILSSSIEAKTYTLEIELKNIFDQPGKNIQVELASKNKPFVIGYTDIHGKVVFSNLKAKGFDINIIQNDSLTNSYSYSNIEKIDQLKSYLHYQDISDTISKLVDNYILEEMMNFGYLSQSDLPDSADCKNEFGSFSEAQFYGGYNMQDKFLSQVLQYPDISILNADQGTVLVGFIVDKSGEITNVHIERGISPELDREAKRAIKSMPKWIPGMCNGVPLKVKCSLPIAFSLH